MNNKTDTNGGCVKIWEEQVIILSRCVTKNASMEEKQEILCKLEHSGDLTLDEQTLKEIMKIKDAVEKKRKYGML